MLCPRKGKCSPELQINRKTAVNEDQNSLAPLLQVIKIVTMVVTKKNYHLFNAF